MVTRKLLIVGCLYVLGAVSLLGRAESSLVEELRKLDSKLLSERIPERERQQMLAERARKRVNEANRRSTIEWGSISGLEQWEFYSRQRLQALRDSLGQFPQPTASPSSYVSKTLSGDGFRIENLVFESRPRLWVTANLYVPDPLRKSMPGIVLCHSHHNPKTQGELQDMGMTWARLGCLVLVMDLPGHGERRDHPFHSSQDYPADFPVGRQDYYFRYNLGMQLHLMGDSLMGWMVWDLRRGVDLLLSRQGIDPQKIILMGSVAGGGDPAAVAAALDGRIAAAVPFNFGGPQPETPYPLTDDAESAFDYAGSGSWESTRNLRLSCRDGFLPWLIVAGIAPRRLVYAHEFSWDQQRDPVWKRLLRVHRDLYRVPDHLDYTHGFGLLKQRPPEASHCNNIGAFHRKRIHEALRRWFGVDGGSEHEYGQRRDSEELRCMTEPLTLQLRPLKIHQLASELGQNRLRAARAELARLETKDRQERLRSFWGGLLGQVEPPSGFRVIGESRREGAGAGLWTERVVLETDPGIWIPVMTLGYSTGPGNKPVVVCLAQGGKEKFLLQRAEEVAGLLAGGAAVCLVDVRGTGETDSGTGRGRLSQDTAVSSTELMLGQTLVGSRLRDLRGVLAYLRQRPGLNMKKLAIWGDSFAPVNGSDSRLEAPLGIEMERHLSEPLGGLLALLGALFEEDVRAVYVSRGLLNFASVLSSPFCYLPHDVVVPGALQAGDLQSLAAALHPRAMLLEGLVDGRNRPVDERTGRTAYEVVFEAYRSTPDAFGFNSESSPPKARVDWLLRALE